MLASLILAIYSFGLTTARYLPSLVEDLHSSIEFGVLFLILFGVAAYLLSPYFAGKTPGKTTRIKNNEVGEIDISLKAVEDLIKRAALNREGVEELKVVLSTEEDVLNISLRIDVEPDRELPQLTEDLQNYVKNYLERTTGVSIGRIKVKVEKVVEGKGTPNLVE